MKTAGLAPGVQWLMTAPADACFLVTVQSRGTGSPFTVLAYLDTIDAGRESYEKLVRSHLEHKSDVAVEHEYADTPGKRLASLQDAVPAVGTPQPLNKRARFGGY